MAAAKGKELILSIGAGSPIVYTEIGSARDNGFTINEETVDVTTKDHGGWRELLSGAGIKSASTSVSGVLKDTAAEAALLSAKLGDAAVPCKLSFESGDFTGLFVVTSFELTGTYNGEQTFSASLESAGEIEFTAAV